MRIFGRITVILCVFVTEIITQAAHAQSIIDPKDVVVDTTAHRKQPLFGQIGKWERTQKVNWNSSSYKAYIYKGRQFRVKFPKTYSPSADDGKKYPVYVFFHGLGEKGNIYDNDYQLYNGGLIFSKAVDSGKFDGYLLFMQSEGFFGDAEYQLITEILDYMTANNKVDPFRIYVNGVSAGGQAVWEMLIRHPDYVTCAVPISYSSTFYIAKNIMDSIRFAPIWLFQGGLDLSPSPYTSHQVRDSLKMAGGRLKYKEYSTLGHVCWDSAWLEPDFFSYMLKAYSSNPWPLFGKTDYAPTETINDTLGLLPGFDQYQWRKDSIVIQNGTKNYIRVTEPGVYDARVLKGTLWSDWSHEPVTITGPAKPKDPGGTAYPMPFRDYFIITIPVSSSNGQAQLMMYDLAGKMVYHQLLYNLINGINKIRVQPQKGIAKGMYFVKIITEGNNSQFIKLVKQ